jgi:three-Cys-motif partner protein
MRKRPKNTVGPWAKEKLEALGEYLEFYTKVLKNQGHWLKATIFVDAFAGPGKSRVRVRDKPASVAGAANLFGEVEPPTDSDAIEFLKGSPRVALDIQNPFTRYVFIERDPARASDLRALAEEYGTSRSVSVREGDAGEELRSIVESGLDWSRHRAVVFLDPFGMHIPWSVVEALGRTKAIEVLVNFPLGMAIQRFLVRSGDIPTGWRETLDSFFGSRDWWQHAYEDSEDLFGPKSLKLKDSGLRLLEWYRSRLKDVFGHVSPGRLIRNTQGGHLYYLVWAGPHRKGLDGAKHILSKGEKVG